MKYQKRQERSSYTYYEILSLTRAKAYIYSETGITAQDDVITDLIKSSVSFLQTSLDFIVDTDAVIYQYYDTFGTDGCLPIWHRYIITTSFAVHYWDGSTWQEFSSANYRIDTTSTPPKVVLKDGSDWPDLTSDTINSVRVTFKINTSHPFNYDLKAAIMTMVAAKFENREGFDIPASVQAFIDRYRLPGG